MPILEFNSKGFMDAIKDLAIPINQADTILDAIDHDSNKESDYDEIALHATKEKGLKESPVLFAIKLEIFDYYCTDSLLYSDIREATITATQLITVITEQVAKKTESDPKQIVPGVAIALIGALKLGQTTWCNNQYEE